MIISQFENATVVQNWNADGQRRDGSVIDPTPFVGSIPMSGPHDGAVQELREDHPWLAYHRDADGRLGGSVRADLDRWSRSSSVARAALSVRG